MTDTEKDIRAALADYYAADTHQKASAAIERWLFATTPKKLEALFAEIDQLRKVQTETAINALAVPMTTKKRYAIFVSALNIYRSTWPKDIETRIAAVCNYVCSSTEAAHGIAKR